MSPDRAHLGEAGGAGGGITVATVLGVWRQAELVEQARAVTTRILASLVTREDGLRIVSYLRNNVDRLMGLNVVRAEPLKKLLSTFLETGGLLVTAG